MGVAQLVAGITGPQGSPVVAVGGAAIDHTPPPVKNFAISAFGSNDKTALVAGILVVLAVFAALIGVAAVRRIGYGLAGLAVFTGIGLLAALTRPDAGLTDAVPVLAGAAVGAFVMTRLARAAAAIAGAGAAQEPAAASPTTPEPRPGAQPDRRRFLITGSAAVAVAGVSALAGARLAAPSSAVVRARSTLRLPAPARPAPALPAGADLRIGGLSPFITPNGAFYRVDTALLLPQVAPANWQLRIHGMVEREITISFADLLKLPLIESYTTLACVSNPVSGPYIGNAKWLGASLASLLRSARIKTGADQLLCTSADGFTSGTPVQTVMDGRDALLAVAMNGAPLPVAHGFPARMVVPGLYGYVSACKWVTDINVTTFAAAQGLLGAARLVAAGPDQDRVADRRAEQLRPAAGGPQPCRRCRLGTAQGHRRGGGPDRPRPVAAGPAGRGTRDRHLAAVGVGHGTRPRDPHDRGPRHRRDRLHPDRVPGPAGAERRDRLPERHGDGAVAGPAVTAAGRGSGRTGTPRASGPSRRTGACAAGR